MSIPTLQSIVQFFQTYPHLGGVIAFLVVFIEALAIIGVIVPGTITMSTLGFLIGAAILPAGSTFFWAFTGAFCGDYLSYLLGVHYRKGIHNLWPFKKHPDVLKRSEKFFQKHGGKSIFLGRFIGPIRAMIPLVAGMLKMQQGKFLLAAIPSGILWVLVYIMPGVLLGALSLELPPKAAATFTGIVLGSVVLCWLLVWLMQKFFIRICRFIDSYIIKLWKFFTQAQQN